ncbi:MAG: hypothetical protein Q8R86_06200 [Sulfuricurvum sp.]|nr:hypothetical protein [Sulfuricurvum sp.]
MKKIIFTFFSLFALSYGAGTYDTFVFTDTEEKYSLFFCNTATSAEMVAIGLASADYTAISGLRPLLNSTSSQISSSLLSVANNTNLTGNDMKRIRERSYTISIPDQNTTMTSYNALGIKVSDFNYLMALTGLLIGFIFAFALISSIQNIARGK